LEFVTILSPPCPLPKRFRLCSLRNHFKQIARTNSSQWEIFSKIYSGATHFCATFLSFPNDANFNRPDRNVPTILPTCRIFLRQMFRGL
jgi:hypothetical protein